MVEVKCQPNSFLVLFRCPKLFAIPEENVCFQLLAEFRISGCLKMGIFFVAIFIFSFFQCSLCQKCPAIYLRYSKEHSSCKPPSSTCPVFHSGVTDAEALQILDLHNKMRSKVAMGKETSAGGLPQAADMMQMVWDKELATVAQRRVEQCIYEHDCNNCRQVENFAVGQNIAYREMMCYGSRKCPLNAVPDWTDVIKMFYDEVAIFNKKYVKSMVFESGKVYGHFTQMVWSYSWRIGCGFVAFQKGNGYRQLYVCNYGPGGNIVNQPMYETGPPCSSCPTNSCCGKSCARANYDGLCRMNNVNEAPIYAPKENYLFYCDFSVTTGDCSASATEPNRWRYIKALGGSFAEIVLNGGESSTLQLKTPIRPKRNFCFVAKYRSGPTMDGQTSSNSAVVIYEMSNSRPVTMNLPKTGDSQQYFEYSMSLAWSDDTKVSFTFSVPTGASAQFFNIQLLTAKKGRCNAR